MATQTLTVDQQVQQLYIGILNRAADKLGFDYWVNQIESGAMTIDRGCPIFCVSDG